MAQCGAGFTGERENFTVEWLSASMAEERDAKATAERLGNQIRSYGRAAGAVETMTETWNR